MKVIALVPFKNEAHILPTYFSSLVGIVDSVIGFDDGSIDDSRKIFNSLGGQIIDRHDVPDWGNGGQRFVRELLLKSGRIAGGTHFICLDADEALSSNFNNSAKSKIEKMNPGEKIALKWITLWKDLDHYCGESTVWEPRYKDFIFCDRPDLQFTPGFLHFSRTPVGTNQAAWNEILSEDGVVLHFQFAFWDRAQAKQAWYRCLERTYTKQSVRHINETYVNSLDQVMGTLNLSDKKWFKNLEMPRELVYEQYKFYFDDILSWINANGIAKYRYLDIWRIKELEKEYLKRCGEFPKNSRYPNFYTNKVSLLREKVSVIWKKFSRERDQL